jgi:hypothetical protein
VYNPETIESLLAYTGRHTRPASSVTGFAAPRRTSVRSLLRKVRRSS